MVLAGVVQAFLELAFTCFGVGLQAGTEAPLRSLKYELVYFASTTETMWTTRLIMPRVTALSS